MRVSYADFRYAYGGDWGSRLRVIAYPSCFVTTPEVAECSQGTIVPSVNDVATQTVTFTTVDLSSPVEVAPGTAPDPSSPVAPRVQAGRSAPMVAPMTGSTGGSSGGTTYALSAAPAGSSGNYGAVPTKPSDAWQVGAGSGEFSYSYPFSLPAPAVGGSAPGLSASYSSGSVDGMNMAENGQASMMGLGWNLSENFISRQFASCLDDGHTGFADLCWKTVDGELYTEYSIVLNGHSTTIVRDAGGALRLQNDPGWTVTKVAGNGTSTSLPNNADTGDEAIKIMDPDGTTYWFGFGWGSNSVLTVPVFGDDAGEPCYDSSDIHKSWCQQAWRWGLDKVIDRHGNVTLYDYATQKNYYGRFNQSGTANRTAYDRDGYVTSIRYGFNRGNSTTAYSQVLLDVRLRCIDGLDPTVACTGSRDPYHDPAGWPDTPTDQLCTSTQTTCSNITPSFFSTTRYDKVRTQRVYGSTTYPVDQYQLTFAMPANPDSLGDRSLWLQQIQRTGQDGSGSDIALPGVFMGGVWLQNRVDPAYNTNEFERLRVDLVRTETGGRIDVTYGHAPGRECDTAYTSTTPRFQSVLSARECYPRLLPQTGNWGWWHKYVVTRIALGDDALGYHLGSSTTAPISFGRLRVYDYDYLGAPGWRYRSSLLTDNDAETWDDWRGYEEMVTHTRRVGANQIVDGQADTARSDVKVFRGLDNTKLNGSPGVFRSEDVTTVKGTYLDSEWRNGRVAQQVDRDQDNSELGRVAYEYNNFKTADSSITPDAYYTYRSAQFSLPRVSGAERTTTWTVDGGGSTHRGKLLGAVTVATDDGGTSSSSDDVETCTSWLNSASTALRVPRRVLVRQSCPSGTLLKQTDYYYDGDTAGGAAPTTGDPTYTTVYSDGTAASAITTRNSWDTYGRPMTTQNPVAGGPTAVTGSTPYTHTDYNPSGSPDTILSVVKVTGPKPTPTTAGFVSTQNLSRARGLVTSATDPNGGLTTVARDALGRPTSVWLPGNSASDPANTKYSYIDSTSEPGRVATDTLRDGNYDRQLDFYDGWGRPIQTSTLNAPGGTINRMVSVTAYDENSNVWFSTPAMPIASSSDAVVPTSRNDVGQYTEVTTFDLLGRPTRVEQGSNGALMRATATSYGTASDTVTTLDAEGNKVAATTSTYNPKFEVASVTQYLTGDSTMPSADDGYAEYTYWPMGQLKSIKTPGDSTGSHTTGMLSYTYVYDQLGRKTQATDPDTGVTTYTYDPLGDVTEVSDAMAGTNGTIRTTYDALGRPQQRTSYISATNEPVLADWTYDDTAVPNSIGRLTKTISHTDLGDFTSSVDSFDDRGNPLSATQTYPAVLTGEGASGTASKTMTQTYNELGQVLTTTYPAVPGLAALTTTTQYGRNGVFAGLTTSMTGGTRTLASVAYDTLNRPLSVSSTSALGSADLAQMKRAYTWTDEGRLATLAAQGNNGTAFYDQLKYAYAYDTVGNPTQITGRRQDSPTDTVHYGAWCYGYDKISRLTSAGTATGSASGTTCAAPVTDPEKADVTALTGQTYDLAYTYAQTRLKTVTARGAGSSPSATFDYPSTGAHQHAPDSVHHDPAGTFDGLPDEGTLTYDLAGRATQWDPAASGAPTSDYTYDAQGNLTQVDDPATTGAVEIQNAYDADGIRLARKTPTSTVVYIAGAEITNTDGARTSRRTLTTPGGTPLAQQTSGAITDTWTWLFGDTQHTIKLAKDAGTGVVTTYAYYPFGEPISVATTLPGERGYLDKTHDPDGTIRLDHRSYDPGHNVLTTPDPLMTPTDPQNLNAYSYSGNNPVTFADPSGLIKCELDRESCSGGLGGPAMIAETKYQIFAESDHSFEDRSGLWNAVKDLVHAGADIGKGANYAAHHPVNTATYFAKDTWNTITGCLGTPGFGSCTKLGVEAAMTATGVVKGLKTLNDLRKLEKFRSAAKSESRLLNDVEHLPCNCFVAGTKVHTAKGEKPIQDIDVGDRVWARNLESGKNELRTVTGLFHKHADQVMTITVSDGAKVTVTEEHPFFVAGLGWVMSGDLKVGDQLAQRDGGSTKITAIDVRQADTTVYNFTVEGDHNYYVTEAQLLVHNCDLGASIAGHMGSRRLADVHGSTEAYIESVIHGDAPLAQMRSIGQSGRAIWRDGRNIIIRDPMSVDGGTAFSKPSVDAAIRYFDNFE